MYHEFIKIELLAKEDVPEELRRFDANIIRLTCRETQNVLFAAIRAKTLAIADGITQSLTGEQSVDFEVDLLRFDYHGHSGSVHTRDITPGFLPAKCSCEPRDGKFTLLAKLDKHELSLLVLSAMWAANYHDFRLIEFLCILDPWGFHHTAKRMSSEWSDGIEVADARRKEPPRYKVKPMTEEDFDLPKLLQRMKDPQAPVYYTELREWIVCKADTLNKYLKASGLAPQNIQFKGWYCQTADIVGIFIPYLKKVPACHPNFFKVEQDLSKAGIP